MAHGGDFEERIEPAGVGAGGLGLLVSEAVSLFQWGRLATLLLTIIALVAMFEALSRKIRHDIL